MKKLYLSELIEGLQKIEEMYGDLPVSLPISDGMIIDETQYATTFNAVTFVCRGNSHVMIKIE